MTPTPPLDVQSNIFYIDGEYIEDRTATLPVSDLAVVRGYGVFDFLRTYSGKPFHLDQHLERLRRSAELIDLELPWTLDEIKAVVLETLSRNDHAESNVRIVVTGGTSDDYITPTGKPRLMVMVTPARVLPQSWYTDGAKIITEPTERYLPGAKSLNYIPAIRALKRARAEDAIEAIYTDREGRVLEGTTTNLFAFFEGVLVTPGDGILPGITRGVVLEIAEGHYPIQLRDIQRDELLRADEVFITASNKQVVPIVRVDDAVIGDGRPGAHTRHMMELFAEYTAATTLHSDSHNVNRNSNRNLIVDGT